MGVEERSIADFRARINAEIQNSLNESLAALDKTAEWYLVKGAETKAEVVSKAKAEIQALLDEAKQERESWR